MNERIKEIMLQATFYANNEFYQDKPLEESWTKLFGEKFAELIIKECADYVQFYYKDHACEIIAHDMKTHFGVEQ